MQQGMIRNPAALGLRRAAAVAATLLVAALPLSARYVYHPPKQVPGVKPCPNVKGSREIIDSGRPAVEMQVMLHVDVDGAPNAYGPRGKKTLDVLKHAYAPGSHQIVGFMTEDDNGRQPTIQGKNDPYPGYYVSQTDFADKNNPRMEDPRRYVDAARINYLVQGTVAKKAGVEMGDFATVYSCRTGKTVYAIVADSGNPSGEEGSLALVRALGYDIRDGIDDSVDDREIVIHYFPHSNPDRHFFHTQQELDQAAEKLGLRR